MLDYRGEATTRQRTLPDLMAGAGRTPAVAADPAQAVHGDVNHTGLEFFHQSRKPVSVILESITEPRAGLAGLDAALREDMGVPGVPVVRPRPAIPPGEPPIWLHWKEPRVREGMALQPFPPRFRRFPEDDLGDLLVRVLGVGALVTLGIQLPAGFAGGAGDVLEEDDAGDAVLVLGVANAAPQGAGHAP